LTFLAGHTLPSRLFRYDVRARSRYDQPLTPMPESAMPRLIAARVFAGGIALTIVSPQATPYAVAFWASATRLRIGGRAAIAAGRAGVVVPLTLQRGTQTVVLHCEGCSTSVLPYAT
jgi:hypothetical protein